MNATEIKLSDTDAAFVRAYIEGAETFTPDPTTDPYDRDGIRAAVEEIADEHGVTVNELVAADVVRSYDETFRTSWAHDLAEGVAMVRDAEDGEIADEMLEQAQGRGLAVGDDVDALLGALRPAAEAWVAGVVAQGR